MFMGTAARPDEEFDALMEAEGGVEQRVDQRGSHRLLRRRPGARSSRSSSGSRPIASRTSAGDDQEKLDRQRDVVRNERRQTSENRPYGKVELRLPELLYPEGHPYHHPVDRLARGPRGRDGRRREGLLRDATTCRTTPRSSSRATSTPRRQAARSQQLFGSIPRGGERRPQDRAPALKLTGVVRETMLDKVQLPKIIDGLAQPRALRRRATPRWTSPARCSSRARPAGSTRGSSRRQEAVAMSVRAPSGLAALGSLFDIDVTAKPGRRPRQGREGRGRGGRPLPRKGPTEAELDAAQGDRRARGKLARLQSSESMADKLNEYQYYFGEPNPSSATSTATATRPPTGVRDWARRCSPGLPASSSASSPRSPTRGDRARDSAPPTGRRPSSSRRSPRPSRSRTA